MPLRMGKINMEAQPGSSALGARAELPGAFRAAVYVGMAKNCVASRLAA